MGNARGAATEQRWGFLLPWCSRLKTVQFRGQSGIENVWNSHRRLLHASILRRDYDVEYDQDKETFAIHLEKVREALALLAAVARVDYDAWKYLLVKYCKNSFEADQEEILQDQVEVRFTLQLDWGRKSSQKFGDPKVYDLVRLCGVQQRTNPSSEYLEALGKISAMDTILNSRKPGEDIFIPIRVYFSPNAEYDPIKSLKHIINAEKIIEQQWREYESSVGNQDVERGCLRYTISLKPMILDVNYFSNAAVLAEMMDELRMNDRWFSKALELSLSRPRATDENVAKEAFGQLMTRLFRIPANLGHSSPIMSTLFQLDSLAVTCDAQTLGSGDFEALCSAMVVNQTTKKISMRMVTYPDDPATSRTWWRWIAYAFFSKRARATSVLKSLTISSITSLSVEDMNGFAAVLASERSGGGSRRSLSKLLGENDATLMADAPIRWKFDDQGQILEHSSFIRFQHDVPNVRALNDDAVSNWIDVIIPGVGTCQVRRSDLVVSDETEARDGLSGITSLAIEFHPYQSSISDGLQHFMEAIGSSLKVLTLSGPRVEVDESFVLRCCPNLEELSLCGGMLDLQLELNGYHANKQLLLQQSCQWHNIAALASDLSNATNLLAKRVRRLRIRLTDQWEGWGTVSGGYDSVGFEADLKPLLDMLEVNQSLEYFEVMVRLEYESYRENFKKLHLKPINRSSKLSIDMKVAFLSVLSPQRKIPDNIKKNAGWTLRPDDSSTQLNLDVLGNIFAFAAPPVLRQVFFRTKRSGWGWIDGEEDD